MMEGMETTSVPLPQPVSQPLLDVWRRAQVAYPELLLTGGAVRDLLLGRPVRDLDVTAPDAPAAASALRAAFAAPAVPLGGPHNLYRIPLEGEAVDAIELTGRGPLQEDAHRRE